jgi:hypothetical protein
MGLINDLIVRIRGDKTHLDSTLKSAGDSVKNFGKKSKESAKEAEGGFEKVDLSLKGLYAAAIGVASAMLMWAKNTEWGTGIVNKALAKTKQLMQDIMTSQTGKGNIKEAGRIADVKSANEANATKVDYEAAKMQSELNQLLVEASDRTLTLADKKNILNKAIEKEAELKKYLLTEAKSELQAAYDYWKINLGNINAKNDYYKAAKKVVEIEGTDSLRIKSMYTETLKEEKKILEDLVKAFQTYEQDERDLQGKQTGENIGILNARLKDYRGELELADPADKKYIANLQVKINRTEALIEKINELTGLLKKASIENVNFLPQNNTTTSVFGKKTYGVAPAISNKLASGGKVTGTQEQANAMADAIEVLPDALNESQTALLGLADTFAGFFSDVNLGFQGMIDGVITGIKRLVAELLANAVILAILNTLFPGSAVPLSLGNILGGSASKLVGGSVSSGGSVLGGSTIGAATGERLVASINGKQIDIALRRMNM